MTVRKAIALTLILGLLAGCVEVYDGARIEANIGVLGISHQELVVPTPGLHPGDPGYFSHYELHANILGMGTIRLTNFLIQPSLLILHPCSQFEDDTYCVDAENSPCEPYINMIRFVSHEDIYLAVSVAPTVPDATGWTHGVAYDFMDPQQFPDELFQDLSLTDPEAFVHRDNLVESEVRAFCDSLHPDYYLGNPNQLTQPRNGSMLGAIDGPDPRTGSVIGGLTFNSPARLEHMTELLITRETDPERLSPGNINRNLPPGDSGQTLLLAQKNGPYGYIRFGEYRGVMTVSLESPLGIPVFMTGTVYYNLDEDPVGF
jgi:hypothetical protein